LVIIIIIIIIIIITNAAVIIEEYGEHGVPACFQCGMCSTALILGYEMLSVSRFLT